jgi:hypothetical protein
MLPGLIYYLIEWFKHVFPDSAFRANKIFRKLFERYIVVICGIIDPATCDALILLHGFLQGFI